MAEKEFRTGDDELLVVTEGDTVGFITRGHDREDLSYDEVRKLISFLQDIVGEGLSVEQLDAMEPDDEVANEVFRYQDDDRDELVVLFYPGDETIVVHSSTYGEPSMVPLPREEGIKLAHAILTALDAEPEQGLTPRALDGMPEGTIVYDTDGEEWCKHDATRWKFYAGTLYRTSVDLIEQYGPIMAKAPEQ